MVIAVHSRALGPAVGGVRLRRYPGWREGLADALRLSEAMTYKCAAAGLPFGGGKTVLALDGETPLTPALRRAALADLGEFIDSFGGSYLAGPDVGTGPADMVTLREKTPHAFCLPEDRGGTGSSSGPTAAGVLAALRAAARQVFGADDLDGLTVLVSGMGSVGSLVAQGLSGAHVLISDVDESKKDDRFDWVQPEDALRTAADIFVPAAVGGVLGPDTAGELEARLVVGPANNQLTADEVADLLAGKGIVWIPDFVASAGGVVYTLGREVEGLGHDEAMDRVDAIGRTVETILAADTTPLAAAMELATARLELG